MSPEVTIEWNGESYMVDTGDASGDGWLTLQEVFEYLAWYYWELA